MVQGIGSAVVYIKADLEVCKVFLHRLVVLVDDGLWGSPFFHGLDRNRRTMFITSTNKNHIPFLGSEVTGINVCRNIGTGKVTNMLQAVCVGKRRSNQVSFGKMVHWDCFVSAKIAKCNEGFGAFFGHKT